MRTLGRMSRSEINNLYARLLEHHKLLLEATRAEYEREHGPVPHPGALLQLVINDAAFAWLQPFTGLLVDIDDPKLTPDVATARAKVERLFSPETPAFHPRYRELVETLPDAARSHEQTMQTLASLGQPQ